MHVDSPRATDSLAIPCMAPRSLYTIVSSLAIYIILLDFKKESQNIAKNSHFFHILFFTSETVSLKVMF